jgi:hypothetical protein
MGAQAQDALPGNFLIIKVMRELFETSTHITNSEKEIGCIKIVMQHWFLLFHGIFGNNYY